MGAGAVSSKLIAQKERAIPKTMDPLPRIALEYAVNVAVDRDSGNEYVPLEMVVAIDDVRPLLYRGLLFVLFPLFHDNVDDLGEPLHFLLHFQTQTMRVDAATDINRNGKPPGQDLGYAGCVLNARC